MTNTLRYRYSDFTKLTMSEKLGNYLLKFTQKFGVKPVKIYLNDIHEKELGINYLAFPVEYKSTLNLGEMDFVFPDGFVPSQSI